MWRKQMKETGLKGTRFIFEVRIVTNDKRKPPTLTTKALGGLNWFPPVLSVGKIIIIIIEIFCFNNWGCELVKTMQKPSQERRRSGENEGREWWKKASGRGCRKVIGRFRMSRVFGFGVGSKTIRVGSLENIFLTFEIFFI